MEADVTHSATEHTLKYVTPQPGWRRVLLWVADHELWWVVVPLGLLALVDRVPVHWLTPGLVPLAGVWLARRLATGRWTVPTPLDVPWVLVLLMGVVALYPSVDPGLSQPAFLKLVLEAALFYQVANGVRGLASSRLWSAVGLLFVVGVGLAVLGLLNTQWSSKFLSLPGLYAHLPRLLSWLNPAGFNRNIVGGSLAMILPVVAGLLISRPARISRVVLIPLFVGFAAVSVLSQSRGALAGIVVAAAAMVMLWKPRWGRFVVPLGIACFIAIWWLVGIEPVADFLLASELGSSAQGRLELWSRAIYMMQDFPYTGIGIGTFGRVTPVLYPLFLIGPDTYIVHSHNLYLQAGVDLGVRGLVAFMALLSAIPLCAVRAVRHRIGDERVLAIGLSGGLVVYLVHGVMDHITFSTEASAVMWIIGGLIVALGGPRQACERERGKGKKRKKGKRK